jgi:hypothetical protein
MPSGASGKREPAGGNGHAAKAKGKASEASPAEAFENVEGLQGDPRWIAMLEDVRKESLATFCLLFEGPAPALSGDTLAINYPHRLRYFAPLVQDALHSRILRAMAKRHFGEAAEVRVVVEEAGDDPADAALKAALDIFPGSQQAALGE